MALLHTPALDETLAAADFALKDVSGKTLKLADIKGKGKIAKSGVFELAYEKLQAEIEKLIETSA